MKIPNPKSQIPNLDGQVLIVALIFMAVILVFSGSLFGYTTLHLLGQRKGLAREQALNLAEAGIEKAVYELNWGVGQGYTGESNFNFGGGVVDITVTTPSPGSRLATATAYVPNKTSSRAQRRIQTELEISGQVVAFSFGVQIGNQNLDMDQNARVIGSVFANSPIIGENNARIVSGSATSAGPSGRIENLEVDVDARARTLDDVTALGSAYANFIDNSDITGNVQAGTFEDSDAGGNVTVQTIRRCTIGGNAYYNTKTRCTISGTEFPGQGGTPPADPTPENLPVTDAQLTQWKADAEAGGTINGNYQPTGSVSLGPKKINGNLILDGQIILTMTGRIWVTGNIDIKNKAGIQLASSYGTQSEVVIADGWVHSENNGVFSGSGTAGSFLMLLSTDSGTGHHAAAIDLHNNATGAIFYAHNSKIHLHPTVTASQLTGQGVEMENTAVITYDVALQNAFFGAAPGASWAVKRGTRIEKK